MVPSKFRAINFLQRLLPRDYLSAHSPVGLWIIIQLERRSHNILNHLVCMHPSEISEEK